MELFIINIKKDESRNATNIDGSICKRDDSTKEKRSSETTHEAP